MYVVLTGFCLYICVCMSSGGAPSTLRFTNILFRHGDRSPIGPFPGDLYNESAWPQGYGQLTQVGIKQEYALGDYLRTRYSGFLSETYSRHEVYVFSTDKDRTLMSASSVLAALFPPSGRQVWSEKLDWQPVPIHTINLSNEKMLHYRAESCPVLKKIWDTFDEAPAMIEFQNRYKVVPWYGKECNITCFISGFKRRLAESKSLCTKARSVLEKISNATQNKISSLPELSRLQDTLLCERLHGLKWPAWVTDDMFTQLVEIKTIYKSKRFTRQATRLTGGQLLSKMLTDMELAARGKIPQEFKAAIYSAHDTTILALMCALDVYNYHLVPYSTSMYVELHEDPSSASSEADLTGWYVQVWLRNETQGNPPHLLTVPGCTPNCSLARLINLTRDNIATDWAAECGLSSPIQMTGLWQVVLITIACGMALLLALLLVSSCCNGTAGGAGHCLGRRRLRVRPSTYGKLRASEVKVRPEEMPMIGTSAGDSDVEG